MPASDNHASSVDDGKLFVEKHIEDVPDVSKRLPADELLRIYRDSYLQLVSLCKDGIFLVLNGRIAYVNQAGVDLLAAPDADHLLGRSLLNAVPVHFSKATHDHIQSLLDSSQCISPLRGKLDRNDGSTMSDVELLAAPYYFGDSVGSIVILRDIANPSGNAGANTGTDYLRLVADTIPALIAYVSNEERYLFVNAAYESWFNRPNAEIIGHTLSEVLGAAYANVAPHVAKALQGEYVSHEEKVHIPLKGERTLAILYAPDKLAGGTVRGFSLVAMDITIRRQDERVFQGHERRVRPGADAAPVLIAQCDKEYRLRFINKSYFGRFGLKPEDAIGRRIPELIGEESFALFRQYIDAALAGKVQEHEVKFPSQDFGDQYVHMMYFPECDENGEVQGLIAAFSDTTRLRRAEDQLYRRELEFKTLVENSPDIVSRMDRRMRHIYVNPAIEPAFGIKAANYLGKTKAELGLPADMVAAWDHATQAAFDTGMEKRFEHELIIDGKTRYFSTRVIPEADRNGNIDSLLCITYDVTERTKIEDERDELLARERTARIQAETAARARDEFLAIVSHELRAPLNGIQSWAHVLENYVKEATASPLAQRALQGIKTGVAQQVRLIEDLLDVTRMMSGKLRLVRQPCSALPIVQAAVESVRDIAAAKRINIIGSYNITDEQIEGDSDRIQQIIWNLLSNAVKFTPEDGNIWLTASRIDNNLSITIRDDGIGISPDFLPHLFDRFSQEDTSSTRGHSGLGLGLFLVRYLIELHGGQVDVESEGEGKGATFSVHMPLRSQREKYTLVASSDAATHVTLPSLKGLRVLLIDDQEEARESLTVVLTTAGASIFAAESVKAALEWLPSLTVADMPDILVCDIAMPGEDGYSVLQKIRAWKTESDFAPLRRLPALALTAFAQREDRIRALTAGFQMHITKPVAPEELIVVIATMVSRD